MEMSRHVRGLVLPPPGRLLMPGDARSTAVGGKRRGRWRALPHLVIQKGCGEMQHGRPELTGWALSMKQTNASIYGRFVS